MLRDAGYTGRRGGHAGDTSGEEGHTIVNPFTVRETLVSRLDYTNKRGKEKTSYTTPEGQNEKQKVTCLAELKQKKEF